MARIGDSIVHPVTGERLTFLETAASTGGEFLKLSIEMAPGGALARPHVHPRSEERFEVLDGRVQIARGRDVRVIKPGETVVVPTGLSHVWGNPFDRPATVAVTVSPSFCLETFFETLFGLAADGKIDSRTQLPSLLQSVVLIRDFRSEVQLAGLAGTASRALATILAPLAKARGYRSRYPQYSGDSAP